MLTPIEQAVAYSTFANGGTVVRAPGRLGGRRSDDGTGHQEDRATGHREGADRAGQLQRHAGRLRGCHLEPARNGVSRLPGLPGLVEPGGQDGHRLEPGGPRAEQLVRGLRPQPEPELPRARRHRPGWLRRPGRGTARAQHLRLHRGQPGINGAAKTPTPANPASQTAPATNPPLGTPTTTTTTTPTKAGTTGGSGTTTSSTSGGG